MHIGLTFRNIPTINPFVQGMKQHGWFFYHLLKKLGHKVTFILKDKPKVEIDEDIKYILLSELNYNLNNFNFDFILSWEISLTNKELLLLDKNLIPNAGMQCGNPVGTTNSTMLKNEEIKGNICYISGNKSLKSEYWLADQYFETKDFHRVMHRSPLIMVPYIYEPYFIQSINKSILHKYLKKSINKNEFNIIIAQPNFSFTKNSLIPLLTICDAARKNKNFKFDVIMTNSHKRNEIIQKYVKQYNQNNNLFIKCIGFKPLDELLKTHQIILHHHILNPMNYLVLDALWLDLPVIHNCEFLTDIGYYYETMDLIAVESQFDKIKNHFKTINTNHYKKIKNKTFHKYSIENKDTLEFFRKVLDEKEKERNKMINDSIQQLNNNDL